MVCVVYISCIIESPKKLVGAHFKRTKKRKQMEIRTLLKNIWSIEELRIKIINTIKYVALFLLISHIAMPGVAIYDTPLEYQRLLSIAASGLSPYLFSTVLVGFFIINTKKRIIYSRILTLIIAAVQAPILYGFIQTANLLSPNTSLALFMVINVASSALCIFLAERISEKGICDGRDVLMGVSVLLLLPEAIFSQLFSRPDSHGFFFVIFDIALMVFSLGIAILLSQTLLNIPLKIRNGENKNELTEKDTQILLKLNPGDDYPINFALIIPFSLLSIFQNYTGLIISYSDTFKCFFTFIVTIASTFFYVSRHITPDMIKSSYRSLLIKFNLMPSPEIVEENIIVEESSYDSLLTNATLITASCLSLLSIIPIVGPHLGVSPTYANLIGGASAIFVVNFIMGALRNIEMYLQQYGFESLEKINGESIIGKEVFYLPVEESE